ncbi:MAG: aspartate aminotransferase family protein [Hydrogenobacter sp.]|uniref:aspartate aminotransferase family protein n=1 Tax=Hydrogenobacter thermophilus TaxID=940 RepID=UPI0030F9BC13
MYVMNTYSRLPVSFVRGDGVYLFDREGKKYLDLVAGIAVNTLGYNDPDLLNAVCEQSQRLMHISNLFENPWQEEVAKMLVERFWTEGRVFFCNSGTEANEAGIKLVRRYFREKGENRYRIITFYNGFHGRTYGSMSATAQEKVHKGFEPLLDGFDYAVYNSFDSLLKALRKDTAAIMLEVVQGEGGIRVANYEFLQKVQQLCHSEGLLLVVDEVQTGVGRTGKFFAYEHFDLKPDIVTLAKGLGGGFPIGAVIARKSVSEVFSTGSHGSTFGGNPLACACAKVVISKVSELLDHVMDTGAYFKRGLERLKTGKVRGLGLMLGLDLERDCSAIVKKALDHGLVINCTAGTVLRFVPPLIIQKDHINIALALLERVLKL